MGGALAKASKIALWPPQADRQAGTHTRMHTYAPHLYTL